VGCGRPVGPSDRTRSQTIAIDDKPGDSTQRRFADLPCKPGREERLERALRPKPCRLALHGEFTMARGAEACAAMVARADLRLAEAAVPDRPRHADISRSDLSQSLVQTRGVLKKDLTAQLRTRRQMRHAKGRQGQEWTRAHTRYGLYPRADPPRPRIAQFLAIGKEIFYRSKRTRTS